jgi:hypothetical protein
MNFKQVDLTSRPFQGYNVPLRVKVEQKKEEESAKPDYNYLNDLNIKLFVNVVKTDFEVEEEVEKSADRRYRLMLNLIMPKATLPSVQLLFEKSENELQNEQEKQRNILRKLTSVFADIGEEQDALETMQMIFNRAENNFKVKMMKARKQQTMIPVVEVSANPIDPGTAEKSKEVTEDKLKEAAEEKPTSTIPASSATEDKLKEAADEKSNEVTAPTIPASPEAEKRTPNIPIIAQALTVAHLKKIKKHKRIISGVNLMCHLVKSFNNKKKIHVAKLSPAKNKPKKSRKTESGKNKRAESYSAVTPTR